MDSYDRDEWMARNGFGTPLSAGGLAGKAQREQAETARLQALQERETRDRALREQTLEGQRDKASAVGAGAVQLLGWMRGLGKKEAWLCIGAGIGALAAWKYIPGEPWAVAVGAAIGTLAGLLTYWLLIALMYALLLAAKLLLYGLGIAAVFGVLYVAGSVLTYFSDKKPDPVAQSATAQRNSARSTGANKPVQPKGEQKATPTNKFTWDQ